MLFQFIFLFFHSTCFEITSFFHSFFFLFSPEVSFDHFFFRRIEKRCMFKRLNKTKTCLFFFSFQVFFATHREKYPRFRLLGVGGGTRPVSTWSQRVSTSLHGLHESPLASTGFYSFSFHGSPTSLRRTPTTPTVSDSLHGSPWLSTGLHGSPNDLRRTPTTPTVSDGLRRPPLDPGVSAGLRGSLRMFSNL